jgi:hypothetical protein
LVVSTANAVECPDDTRKYVVGLASKEATDVQIYCIGRSIVTRFNDVAVVPGFENCELIFLVRFNMKCDGDDLYVNAPTYTEYKGATCMYHGIHRDGGLGFNRKATWDVWKKAARECGESPARIEELEEHFNNWAKDDPDPRYKK